MSNAGFDPTIGSLNTILNLRLMNENLISSNIANADTPGFKAKTMDFETALRRELGTAEGLQPTGTTPGKAEARGTNPIEPEIYDDPNGVESLDGNTVDRANEMAKLAENQLLYDAAIELMKRKLGMLKYGISEGGGNR